MEGVPLLPIAALVLNCFTPGMNRTQAQRVCQDSPAEYAAQTLGNSW
jgi:hypothetical protein